MARVCAEAVATQQGCAGRSARQLDAAKTACREHRKGAKAAETVPSMQGCAGRVEGRKDAQGVPQDSEGVQGEPQGSKGVWLQLTAAIGRCILQVYHMDKQALQKQCSHWHASLLLCAAYLLEGAQCAGCHDAHVQPQQQPVPHQVVPLLNQSLLGVHYMAVLLHRFPPYCCCRRLGRHCIRQQQASWDGDA